MRQARLEQLAPPLLELAVGAVHEMTLGCVPLDSFIEGASGLERARMGREHRAESRGLPDEAPGPTADLVSFQPKGAVAFASRAPVRGLLPVTARERRNGAGEDAVLLFAEGV